MTKKEKTSKPKKSFSARMRGAKLKLTLFRIWFFKNILVWIGILSIVLIICILTGQITAQTPVLGKVIYPIFAPLIDEITEIVEYRNLSDIMDFFAAAVSILLSIAVSAMKLRSIAITDIKSDKLKAALIAANLYFNSDGKLVKKAERMTQTDIDGDGKIDDQETDPLDKKRGFFHKMFGAISEFFIIAKADFSGSSVDGENEYNKVMEEANLKAAEAGLKDVREAVVDGSINAAVDFTLKQADKGAERVAKSDKISDLEKVEKIHAYDKLKKKISDWREARAEKKRKAKEEAEAKKDSDIEVISNNTEAHAEVKTTTEVVAPKTINDILKGSSTSSTTNKSTGSATVEDYFKKLKGR